MVASVVNSGVLSVSDFGMNANCDSAFLLPGDPVCEALPDDLVFDEPPDDPFCDRALLLDDPFSEELPAIPACFNDTVSVSASQ